jgi:PST family polysaccharide transporter
VPAQILNFDWFFQGIEKMKYFTILSFISRFIFTVSIFFVIKTQSDFILIPFLTFIGTLFSGLFALYLIFIRYKVRIYFPGIKNIIETLKLGWSVFISLIAPNLYNSFSTVVLKIFYGDIAVGIYDAGRRVNSISEQLPIILSKATFPFLSRRIDKHKSFMKYNMMLCLFISILNLVFAEIIVKILYTPEFNKAVWVIRIMAFTPFAYSLVNGYGINYLLQVGKEKVFKNIILLCSVLGFILLFVLIPFFSFYGAAATVLIIYFLKGIISRHYALKLIK